MTERGNVPARELPAPPVITLVSRCSAGAAVGRTGTAAATSGATPFAASDLLAFPFLLEAPTVIYKGFWVNGSAAGGNYAVAIYDADFKLLAQSASTAAGSNSVPAVATLAAKLPAGLYYCGLAHDDATTNRVTRWSVATTGAGFWKMLGCWRQASVTLATLPNPATPVACNNIAFPLYGLITRSGFDV